VETPRKFITAKLSIRKPGSSSVLIMLLALMKIRAYGRACKILKKVVALGAGNTHNLVARGHFSLAHIKLDKNKRMKLNEPQQNRCLFNC
jgi:hypothetical protein